MDFRSNIPLYLQVMDDIKKKIITGDLALGARLPSTRELAVQYQINPNTAVRVYNELESQGITFTRRGIGTFVTEDPSWKNRLRREMAETLIGDLVGQLKEAGFTKQELLDTISRFYDQPSA
ncbi:MAG: GntR family transcriptional regulator [Lachnospiraceae bacterium]|nr:GntR family transcriptional regulator [Lachnospiraceae bacterium]